MGIIWSYIKWTFSVAFQTWKYTTLFASSLAILYGGITWMFPTLITGTLSPTLAILQVAFVFFVVLFLAGMVGLVLIRLTGEKLFHIKFTEGDKPVPKTIALLAKAIQFGRIHEVQNVTLLRHELGLNYEQTAQLLELLEKERDTFQDIKTTTDNSEEELK